MPLPKLRPEADQPGCVLIVVQVSDGLEVRNVSVYDLEILVIAIRNVSQVQRPAANTGITKLNAKEVPLATALPEGKHVLLIEKAWQNTCVRNKMLLTNHTHTHCYPPTPGNCYLTITQIETSTTHPLKPKHTTTHTRKTL